MIPTTIEPDPGPPFEHCCFCGKPTRHWTNLPDRTPGAQVACCQACARLHEPQEVPTKDAWCDAEYANHPSLRR